MAKEKTYQSGGINIDGPVSSQGDLVGRDKIIQNIVLVGQFLDYTQIDELIPRYSSPTNFESVATAFETIFAGRPRQDLTQAITITGEVLGEVLRVWRKKESSSPVQFRQLLPSIAAPIIENLKRLHLWEAFCESVDVQSKHPGEVRSQKHPSEVIWLHALQKLWRKQYKQELLCGIAEIKEYEGEVQRDYGNGWAGFSERKVFPSEAIFVFQASSVTDIRVAHFQRMSHEHSRVFLAGLVTDLLRLAVITANDAEFVDGLIEMLTSGMV